MSVANSGGNSLHQSLSTVDGNSAPDILSIEEDHNPLNARYSNFDYFRLFLSLEVVASHLYAGLQYQGYLWLPIPPVAAFVGLSGFLIPQALDRSSSTGYFGKKRALRTLPALVPLMIAISIIFGPRDAEGAFMQYITAGYFGEFRGVILPLWSLIVEDALYAIAAGLFVYSLHRSILVTATIIVFLAIANGYIQDPLAKYRFLQTSISFFTGNLINMYHARLRNIHWIWPALLVVACTFGWFDRLLGQISLPLFIGATIVLAMTLPQAKLLFADLSYGIYIWHAPIMIWLLDPLGMTRNATWVVVTLLITLGVALLSYYLVEKPSLRFKDRLRT